MMICAPSLVSLRTQAVNYLRHEALRGVGTVAGGRIADAAHTISDTGRSGERAHSSRICIRIRIRIRVRMRVYIRE